MLQIEIHHDYGVALHGVQPGRQGDLMAEIPRQRIDPHTGVVLRQLIEQLQRAIVAAVVHENDLVVQVRQTVQRGFDRLVEEIDHLRFVITGDHNAE